MTAMLSAHGRLARDPESRQTKTGKPMATATIAVDMPPRYGAEEGERPPTLWLQVLAFEDRAIELGRLAKGDLVSVAGKLQMEPYTARDGSAREGWKIIADSLISARSSRPGQRQAQHGGDRAPAGNGAAGHGPPPHATDLPPPPLDDDLPF